MSNQKPATPVWKQLNQLSHDFGFDTPRAVLLSDAASLIQRLTKTLADLHTHAATRPALCGTGVQAVREGAKFMASLEASDALLRELGELS